MSPREAPSQTFRSPQNVFLELLPNSPDGSLPPKEATPPPHCGWEEGCKQGRPFALGGVSGGQDGGAGHGICLACLPLKALTTWPLLAHVRPGVALVAGTRGAGAGGRSAQRPGVSVRKESRETQGGPSCHGPAQGGTGAALGDSACCTDLSAGTPPGPPPPAGQR